MPSTKHSMSLGCAQVYTNTRRCNEPGRFVLHACRSIRSNERLIFSAAVLFMTLHSSFSLHDVDADRYLNNTTWHGLVHIDLRVLSETPLEWNYTLRFERPVRNFQTSDIVVEGSELVELRILEYIPYPNPDLRKEFPYYILEVFVSIRVLTDRASACILSNSVEDIHGNVNWPSPCMVQYRSGHHAPGGLTVAGNWVPWNRTICLTPHDLNVTLEDPKVCEAEGGQVDLCTLRRMLVEYKDWNDSIFPLPAYSNVLTIDGDVAADHYFPEGQAEAAQINRTMGLIYLLPTQRINTQVKGTQYDYLGLVDSEVHKVTLTLQAGGRNLVQGSVYFRYCGWEVPFSFLNDAEQAQVQFEGAAFYYCGCGWDLETPDAVYFLGPNSRKFVRFEDGACIQPQDATIVGDVISTEIRLPFRELNSQLGALAAAAFYTNPAVSLEVSYQNSTSGGTLAQSAVQLAAPSGGSAEVAVDVDLSALLGTGTYTLVIQVRVDPGVEPDGVEVGMPWVLQEYRTELSFCWLPDLVANSEVAILAHNKTELVAANFGDEICLYPHHTSSSQSDISEEPGILRLKYTYSNQGMTSAAGASDAPTLMLLPPIAPPPPGPTGTPPPISSPNNASNDDTPPPPQPESSPSAPQVNGSNVTFPPPLPFSPPPPIPVPDPPPAPPPPTEFFNAWFWDGELVSVDYRATEVEANEAVTVVTNISLQGRLAEGAHRLQLQLDQRGDVVSEVAANNEYFLTIRFCGWTPPIPPLVPSPPPQPSLLPGVASPPLADPLPPPGTPASTQSNRSPPPGTASPPLVMTSPPPGLTLPPTAHPPPVTPSPPPPRPPPPQPPPTRLAPPSNMPPMRPYPPNPVSPPALPFVPSMPPPSPPLPPRESWVAVLAVLSFPDADLANLPTRFELDVKDALAGIANRQPNAVVASADVTLLRVVAGSVIAETRTRLPSLESANLYIDTMSCCLATLFQEMFSGYSVTGPVRLSRVEYDNDDSSLALTPSSETESSSDSLDALAFLVVLGVAVFLVCAACAVAYMYAFPAKFAARTQSSPSRTSQVSPAPTTLEIAKIPSSSNSPMVTYDSEIEVAGPPSIGSSAAARPAAAVLFDRTASVDGPPIV